jgi:hypothetical protein
MIKIKIDRTGNIAIKVMGVKGAACKEVSAFLERALGQKLDEQLTTEFYYIEEETDQSGTETMLGEVS